MALVPGTVAAPSSRRIPTTTHIATVTAEIELRLVVAGGPSLPVLAGLQFLHQTYLAVPLGAESKVVDLDAELALLLQH